MKKNIYIAGCGGMLGEAFKNMLSPLANVKCSDIDLNESWLTYMDIRDLASYKKDVMDFRADYIIHLGALTDLEYCELHPSEAYATNVLGVENAVYVANLMEVPLVYVSTAGIFDGNKEVYDDWDIPAPLGHYGRSKYMGEVFVSQHMGKHIICRAGWMMGGGRKKDKKFVNKIVTQLLSGKRELFIVDDKLGTPTYTVDFAATVMKLLELELWGVYNTVCSGMTSRLEVAMEIVSIMGLKDTVSLIPVTSEHFHREYFAPRPASERLLTSKLDLRSVNKMRDWRSCLSEYLSTGFEL